MDRTEAISRIKEACKGIAVDLMKINQAIAPLGDEAVQKELYETIYRVTKDVEIIKKRVIKLESAQDTPEL